MRASASATEVSTRPRRSRWRKTSGRDGVGRHGGRGRAGGSTAASPDTRIALSTALAAGPGAHLSAAIADPAVPAVVLTGEGPAFCAGADLKNRGAMGATDKGNPFV